MKKDTAWTKYNASDINKLNSIANDYKKFISNNKTEREIVKEVIKRAEEKGFVDLDKLVKGKKK